MATKLVADNKQPNLYFVTKNNRVIAVMTSKTDAIQYAQQQSASLVEDRRQGEVWSWDY